MEEFLRFFDAKRQFSKRFCCILFAVQMTRIIKVLALVLIATFVSADPLLTCPPSDNCFCRARLDGLTIICPKSNEKKDRLSRIKKALL